MTEIKSCEKRPLKEKLVAYYEQLFEDDETTKKPRFWEEFFLLRANVDYLSQRVSSLSREELIGVKRPLNLLFVHCVHTLQVDDNVIRDINALQTLCALFKAVFQKGMVDLSFDAIDIIVGFDAAECQMRNLVESVNKFLTQDYPVSIKNLSLKLLLIILTSADNISQNVLLEYLMLNSVFEAIIQILSSPVSRDRHGYDATVALTLLLNYRKYETANPYVIKLSVLDDEIAVNGLGCVISTVLSEYVRQYLMSEEQPAVGFFGQLTSIVTNILLPPEAPQSAIKISEGVLLALYEAIHLNRNFVTVLTHTRLPSQPATPTSPSPAVDRTLSVPSLAPESPVPVAIKQPSNLMGTFLTLSSVLLQNSKDEKSLSHAKLCLIVLTCVVEDQHACVFLHDSNISFEVALHKATMLHRRVKKDKAPQHRPLACAVLDLMVEFLISHLTKNFPCELYSKSVGVIHRLLCYQKRCKTRLTYHWKEVWNALMNILKFFVSNEQVLLPSVATLTLSIEIARIFNLFITYGDTFLPSPAAYDDLYYELIRMRKVFDDIYIMALKYSSGPLKEVCERLLTNIVNIRAISSHFVPKIDHWCTAHEVASVTPDQVLDVVRSNYDTLTLKLLDGLDHYERYTEKPKETLFFTQLVRSVAQDVRGNVLLSRLEQMTLLSELAAT